MSYAELRQRVHRQATALRSAGLRQGDRVAVLAPNSPMLLEAHFGVPLAGGVLVPINTRLSAPEIGYILAHSGARAMLIDIELTPLLATVREDCPDLNTIVTSADSAIDSVVDGIDYESFLQTGKDDAGPPPLTDENEPISINYTSGTTGKPKGVICTHRGAYLNALSVALELRMGPDSVFLWTLPMFHCNGWCCTWGVTAVGATHVSLRKVEPAIVWTLIDRERVTHFCAAPTVVVALANDPSAKRQTRSQPIRLATGGAPPSPTTVAQMAALGLEIIHLYGMTETYGPSISCAWWPEWDDLSLTEQAEIKARQGVPHPGVGGARIVDASMRDIPFDGVTIGELVVQGNTVCAGYFRDPDATAEAFRGGWLHTGDLGVRHPNGYIELRDRAKDVIISGGENISTIEVEQVIIRHPAVLEAAVVGVPDDRWGEVPKAFVTLKHGAAVSAEELIEFCRQNIAHFKAPRAIAFGELPKTSTGKIQKFVLRDREWAGRQKRIN